MVIIASSASPSGSFHLREPGSVSKVSGSSVSSVRLLLLVFVWGVALLLVPTPTTAKPFDISEFFAQMITHVADKSFADGELDLLDHFCSYNIRPYFHKWRLYYRSQVWCPGWSPIIGTADRHTNSVHAKMAATRSFVHQAVDRGLVRKEEAVNWL
ncbi:anti-lipopolysaccharide factor-like [Homarus americanus]|uniref:Anti-lipopolysaccharide factor-like 9 n=1 Tax=Homarus americanus TaxID=6706 RepID=A0A8J5K346_HOMAM|nr:anti-lipopolysaccharide factor-like [Homarus americanus]KAG7164049.1 anti-lipopolysaccharide factor-like 9 [Homarus americanus]